MKIGVFSDVHDNLDSLGRALEKFKSEGAVELIFCGDFCSPFSARMMGDSGLNIHAVFGNNDGDRFNILQVAQKFSNFRIYGEYIGDIDNQMILGGMKIGVTHYPYYSKPMIKTGWYDCVFFGHSHKAEKHKYGNNLLLNPGEVAGVFGKPTIALIDTEERSSAIIDL